ncbi:site-specific integrase [Streptomyces sp. H10-C2]|uniref:tyrosine-type recombinase/integrase n=1 Tax=unclassified Streptomyces TaxID=2593676 RepID=UPI0024B88E31|nr:MULTISPECIES: site-specific integrase [unclassified Streptomyces]MDJ0341384.1 site-specific integrase [Streptomyces sp. PH10-H1]MDJ0370979.1 site-specific integrase [Streptomyces sp. H10-C2]
MAGHIQDRWYKTEKDADGIPRRVKSDRYGIGLRYRARYVGPDGTEKSQSFPDKQKRLAEQWLTRIDADMSRGQYIDPAAGRTTFRQYATKWLTDHASDINGYDAIERKFRLHTFPHIGTRPIASFQPGHIRAWLTRLESTGLEASSRRVIFGTISAVFNAAVDDGLISKNPCLAKSVQSPKPSPSRIVPWTPKQMFAVQAALPERFRAMVDVGGGGGLRQGEIFGLSLDELDFDGEWIAVRHQLKRVRGKFVFAPPKRGKLRDVPMPGSMAAALHAHMKRFPPVRITLPWIAPDGPQVTKTLLFTGRTGDSVRASYFDDFMWKPALAAAGFIPEPATGERHQAAREHGMHALRHFYASVLLDAGESIRALSTYLGHSDPGFTLRVYTHLMPSSEGRTRKAVDRVFKAPAKPLDGPGTAQAA